MARVEIDGVGIAYEDVGEGEAVLLLHSGFVADGMLPLSGEPSLSAYRLVRYHRRGYGDSDRVAPPVSLVRQAEDAVALLDHLDIPRAHVVGHSLGATIAVQLALGSPERVGSLVVLDCFLPSALSAEAAAVVGAAAAEGPAIVRSG